jgi:hypothetical protein
MSQAWVYISGIFSFSLFSVPELIGKKALLFIVLFMAAEWIGRNNQHALEKLWKKLLLRYAVYYAIVMAIILFAGETQEFIYFQF